jgi:hypothetical protein
MRDTPQTITLDSSDPDGDLLTCVVQSGPSHGTLSGPTPNLTGHVTYAPAAGYFGSDSFTWQVTDPSGAAASATVTIDVLRGNLAPAANATAVSTVYGVPVSVVLTGSDPDGDALAFSVMTLPSHGMLSGVAPNLVYTPSAGYLGADSFAFKANDGQADSAPATVSIDVLPGNVAPTANAASVSTAYGVPASVLLTGSDPDGDALTFSVMTLPSHGTLSGVAPNLVYTPATGYSGADSFNFNASDGQADSAPATVALSVGPASEPPCPAPRLTAVGVSHRQINLSWTDQCGRETGFRIERSKQEKTKHEWKWEPIGTVAANVTSFADTRLQGRRTFYYRVIAITGSVNPPCSNVASASAR